jgi:hypothetical protein
MIGWKADDAWREAMWVFMLSRLIMLIVAFFTMNIVLSIRPGELATHVPPEVGAHLSPNDGMAYLLVWWRWDASHYVRLAAYGYHPGITVFFPLWPIIMHVSGSFLQIFVKGNAAYYFAGVIVANILFYITIVLLYKVTAREWSAKVARTTILCFSCSPYALFFLAGYTESLFACLCVLTFFFLQRGGYKNWCLAAFFASLASLTREAGMLLILPFLVILVRHFWPVRKELLAHWRSIVARILPLAFLPLSVGCYMLYLYLQFGDPLLFVSAAIHWNRHPVLPGMSICVDIASFFTLPWTASFSYTNLTDLVFTVGAFVLIIIALKKLPLEYSLFSLASWLFFNSTITNYDNHLMSYPRYAIVIFPLFIVGSYLLNKRQTFQYLYVIVSIILLSVNVYFFVTSQWVA